MMISLAWVIIPLSFIAVYAGVMLAINEMNIHAYSGHGSGPWFFFWCGVSTVGCLCLVWGGSML